MKSPKRAVAGFRDSLGRASAVHPYAWLWEPLEGDAGFLLRAMFGTKAVYLDGKMVLCFASKAEPWLGVLVCTDRPHHPALRVEVPALAPHPVLPKWLYLPDSAEGFEAMAERLVVLVRQRDARIGVSPQPKRRRRATARRKTKP